MIWRNSGHQWSAAPHLLWSPRAALTWQMSLSLAPIISRGQELKDFSRSLSEHDFQVSSPSQLEDHWNSKFKTKNQILLIDFQIGCLCWRQQSSDSDLVMHLLLAARHVETFLREPRGSRDPNDFKRPIKLAMWRLKIQQSDSASAKVGR